MKKKLIVVIITALDVGGTEKHLLQILPQLHKIGLTIWVYVTNHRGVIADKMESQGIPVISPPYYKVLNQWGRPFVYVVSTLKLMQLIWRYKPALLHFFLPGSYLLGGICGWLMRSRCMLMSRRITNEYQQQHPFLACIEKWLHTKMRMILATSQRVKKELENEGVSSKKIGLIYNGVDLHHYQTSINTDKKRIELGIDKNTFVILIIANLFARKGHRDLLLALALIKDDLPQPWLLLSAGRDAGEGILLDNMSQQLGLSDQIKFLGERQDVIALQAIANMGVVSSHEEGFSNALLECMASEIPMVVTDVGGNAEAIIDGTCGIVIPSKNPQQLSKAILKLAHDESLRQRFSIAAKKRVTQRFNKDRCVSQYYTLYTELLE